MKLSVSLDSKDVEFLDEYAHNHGVASRSAAVKRAVALLRVFELGDAYAEAWTEWEDGEDSGLWDSASADGLKEL